MKTVIAIAALILLAGCASQREESFIDHLSVGDDIRTQKPPE